MSEVGRFGVFLPSYIWEGDGPERARGIKAFAREVEELGFDSLFITDHLLAAKRFYSVSVPRAALGAGRRGRRDRAGPPGDVDPDHAAAQPGDPGQGARHAPVPVREPDDPGRRRRLERRRVRGGRRPQVGARQAHRRDARHHAAAARGRDRHLPRPLLLGRRRVHRADGVAPPRAVDRRRVAAGRSRSRPTCRASSSRSRRASLRVGWLDPATDLPARRDRPRLGRAAGLLPRARPRPARAASSPTRTSCTSS